MKDKSISFSRLSVFLKARYLLSAVVFLMASFANAPLKADDLVFATVASGSGTIFGTINLNTGTFVQVGNSQTYIRGLGEINGVLYAEGTALNPVIYTIDQKTGVFTAIGTAGVNLASFFGSTTTGLFAFGQDGSLYSISPTNGTASFIGFTGINLYYSTSGATTGGVSVGSPNLYLMVSTGDTLKSALYSIDTRTAAATLVGTSSTGTCLKGMASVNGTLYAVSGYCIASSKTYTLDPKTGIATFVGNANNYSDTTGVAPVFSGGSNCGATDVTSKLSVTSGAFVGLPFNFGSFSRRITVTNGGSQPIAGPLYLVFDGLPQTGTNACPGPNACSVYPYTAITHCNSPSPNGGSVYGPLNGIPAGTSEITTPLFFPSTPSPLRSPYQMFNYALRIFSGKPN